MAETVQQAAHCMKCKAKTPVITLNVETTDKGRRVGKGTCPTCGTKVSAFLKSA